MPLNALKKFLFYIKNLDPLAKTVQTNTQTGDLSVPLLFFLSLSLSLCLPVCPGTMEADKMARSRTVSEQTVNSSFTCCEMGCIKLIKK